MPNKPTLEFMLRVAQSAMNKRDFERAHRLYAQAIGLYPNDPEPYTGRAATFMMEGKFQEAANQLDAVISCHPTYSIAYSNKGCVMAAMGRFEESLYEFNRAIMINPNDLGAHFNKGNSFMALRRYEEALFEFEKLLEINQDPTTMIYKGYALGNLGKKDEANAWISDVIKKNSKAAYIYSEMLKDSFPYYNKN